MNVKLFLNRAQFGALVGFLPSPDQFSMNQMAGFELRETVLIQYRSRITAHNLLTWQLRPPNRFYGLNLPLPVAQALHEQLQMHPLGQDLQDLLNELDYRLNNLTAKSTLRLQ